MRRCYVDGKLLSGEGVMCVCVRTETKVAPSKSTTPFLLPRKRISTKQGSIAMKSLTSP
jgi:hypothetical protein